MLGASYAGNQSESSIYQLDWVEIGLETIREYTILRLLSLESIIVVILRTKYLLNFHAKIPGNFLKNIAYKILFYTFGAKHKSWILESAAVIYLPFGYSLFEFKSIGVPTGVLRGLKPLAN